MTVTVKYSAIRKFFLKFASAVAVSVFMFYFGTPSVLAQVSEVSLSASPPAVHIGEAILVSFDVATTSFRSSDSIVMVNASTDRIVSTQRVGIQKSGTKTFVMRKSGTYVFKYRASLRGSPIFAESSPVTVSIPDESLYTLSLSAATLNSGEPLVVTYTGPAHAHTASDRIVVIDTVTNRQVAVQFLGANASGIRTFILRKPGTYQVQYKLSLGGTPVVKTAGPVTVTSPDASLYTLTPSAATLNSGEPLIVTYAGPEYAHQSRDRIVIIDTETNRQVSMQIVGASPSGIKTFILRKPGLYLVQYKLGIARAPVVKTAGPVEITIPDASLYTLEMASTTIESGRPFTVAYAGPLSAYQSRDSIAIIDLATNRQVTVQSVGTSSVGSKTFVLRNLGTYQVQYKLAIGGAPVVKTLGPITVIVPDASLYTLSPDSSVAEVGQPILVTYSGPAFAHRFGDSIVAYESSTGKVVSAAGVGSGVSGVKSFKLGDAGTYRFAYRMGIPGSPIAKRSTEVNVLLLNLARIENYPLRTGPIIAFGDSITFGRDATAGNDFVTLLSGRIGENIVNAGVNGDTSTEALARLEADVISRHPRLVIVFLGGNDFLQKVPPNITFSNLDTIVRRIQADGAAVIILAYRDFRLVNYDERYRQLAISNNAALVPNVMGGILGNPILTTDLVHPRNTGHRIIAGRVEPYLRALLAP